MDVPGVVSLEDLPENNPLITLYPNPTADHIHINLPKEFQSETLSIKVFNSSGTLVKTTDSNGNFQWNLSDLPKGLYFVEISYQGKLLKSEKVILE